MNYLVLSVFMMLVTAMSALIFPSVVLIDENNWWVGVVGALVAVALSLFKKIPSFVVVISSVLSLMLIYALM